MFLPQCSYVPESTICAWHVFILLFMSFSFFIFNIKKSKNSRKPWLRLPVSENYWMHISLGFLQRLSKHEQTCPSCLVAEHVDLQPSRVVLPLLEFQCYNALKCVSIQTKELCVTWSLGNATRKKVNTSRITHVNIGRWSKQHSFQNSTGI